MHGIQHIEKQQIEKMKRAELLSTFGAGVLGAGIALLIPNLLASFSIPILLIGLAMHSVGMVQMRAHEKQSNSPRAAWMEALYWFCWLALAGLLLYILTRLI